MQDELFQCPYDKSYKCRIDESCKDCEVLESYYYKKKQLIKKSFWLYCFIFAIIVSVFFIIKCSINQQFLYVIAFSVILLNSTFQLIIEYNYRKYKK